MYELLALLRLYEVERYQWQQERRALLARCLRAERQKPRRRTVRAADARKERA